MKATPLAIFVADIHLSHKPPVWRSAEPDWYAAMARPLKELSDLQNKLSVPILCAGDIFNKWNAPAELINFAIDHLPKMYAVAGQHDLPNHSLKEIHKSAFWTLVQSETLLEMYELYEHDYGFAPYFYSYGQKIVSNPEKIKQLKVCLAHQYVWTKGYSYQTASEEYHIKAQKGVLKEYDVCVFGDNHQCFECTLSYKKSKHKTKVWNCGSLMRRHSDQIDYKPRLAILYDNGCFDFHYLDISKDKYLVVDDIKTDNPTIDMSSVIKELEKLGDSELDFEDAVKSYLKNKGINKTISDVLLKAMGL